MDVADMMSKWFQAFNNKHTRFVFTIAIVLFSAVEVAYLAWEFRNIKMAQTTYYGSIYLMVMSSTTILTVTPIAFLNYFVKRWVKYQVLCECIWVGVLLVFQIGGTILAIVLQSTMNCGILFSNLETVCQNNSLYIVIDCIVVALCLFLLGNVITVIRHFQYLSSKSVSTILFTDTQRLVMVPADQAPRRNNRSTLSFDHAIRIELGIRDNFFDHDDLETLPSTKRSTSSTNNSQSTLIYVPSLPHGHTQVPLHVHLEQTFSRISPPSKTQSLPKPPPRILAARHYERRHGRSWV